VSVRVVAIDGPAASGKSSTAALVARRLGWAHLDSGALYRAVTLAVLDNIQERGAGSGEQWSPQRIVALAEELPVRLVLVEDVFRPEVAGVDVEEAIRTERVTRRVSEIAAIREVRHWVNVQQREAVLGHAVGVVVDGRDIGTVVFPDAPVKVFLTASPEERARRRLAQRGGRIDPDELRREAQTLAARDLADSTRPVAPMKPAADARLLDTTRMGLEEQVQQVLALARERLPG
jgi:cytidylate kinase